MRTIGDYQIEQQLGQGGMGKAFLAFDPALNRKVVLKVISLPSSVGQDTLNDIFNRFFREGKAGGSLQHKNIVTFYRLGTDEIVGPYIVMEYIAGKSLADYQPPHLVAALEVVGQITQALYFMHSRPQPVIHRDLKPENVFLTEEEELLVSASHPVKRLIAKVGDFGLAQIVTPSATPLTESGHFMGSWPYASPEQIKSAADVDHRADLYAVGMILYHLLTTTFPASYLPLLNERLNWHVLQQIYNVKQKLPDPPSVVRPLYVSDSGQQWNIPPQLDDLVLKLLQPNPDDRYQTALELFRALSAIQTSLAQAPVRIASTSKVTTTAPQVSVKTNGTTAAALESSQAGHLAVTEIMGARNVDAVRKLFAKLGYPITDTPFDIEPEQWYAQSREAIRRAFWIADHNAGIDNFGIVLFEVNDLSTSTLRSLGRDLLRRPGNWLFIAVTPTQKATGEPIYERMLLVCSQRGSTPEKVRLLRLAIDTDRPNRHTLDVLRDIALPDPIPPPAEIYTRILEAFNVESLSKSFYRQYAEMYNALVTEARTANPSIATFDDPQEIKGFVQRLLGRLMFLYFLQKKGWLSADEGFLTTQYNIVDGREENYYRDLLVPLFFKALALPENERNQNPEHGPVWRQADIPFLNGGLFELGVGQEYEPEVYLDNAIFAPDSRGPFLFGNEDYSGPRCQDTKLASFQWVALLSNAGKA